jgi:hypothetical protein
MVGLALHRLGDYPESQLGVQYLIKMIEFEDSQTVNANPLLRFPAAQALIKIGIPARRRLISGGKLSDQNLQLRAYVLAALEQTDDEDWDSGRILAIFRLMRELGRIERNVVPPEDEEGQQRAIGNLRKMISLLTDPQFMSKPISYAPPERASTK